MAGPERRSLKERIEADLRERIEEAVDAACLEAIVRVRQARGLPRPVADSARDRAEFDARVLEFLQLLRAELADEAIAGEAIARSQPPPARDEATRLVTVQMALAQALPDYWQRFDAIKIAYAERAPSGGERRGFFGRLLGGR